MIENIRLSFQGIWGHKMRSLLTMLGIIIGIAAIIAIVSTIKGTNEQIKENLIGAGDNVIRVTTQMNGYDVLPGDGGDFSRVPVYGESKLEELKALPTIEDACMYHSKMLYDGIYYRNNPLSGVNIIGSDQAYLRLKGYTIVQGRNFVPEDFTEYRNVLILDEDTAYSLFEGERPVGKTVEISQIPFTVVGVAMKTGDDYEPTVDSLKDYYTYYRNGFQGMLLVPDSVWPELAAFDQAYQFLVKAVSTEAMSEAAKDAEDLLNAGIKGSSSAEIGKQEGMEEAEVRYKSEDTLEKAKELQKLANSTRSQLIWIAGISLLVGGIGVMNIMLVSVTERTREIGLKKALGARRRVILGQFLTEAAVLTSLGGMIGVGAGIGLAYFIGKLAEVPVAVSVPAIIVSVVFSMVIGIVFGLIPSVKASKLDPIDALRYE